MKSIKKILFVVAALATALAFVSCSNGDDDPSTVAVYKGSADGGTVTITFYDDDTWNAVASAGDVSQEAMSGTYTGDPSRDGTVKLKITKVAGEEAEDIEGYETPVEIKGGKCEVFGGEYTRQ